LKGGNTKDGQFLMPAEYSFFVDPADISSHEMLGFSVHTHQMAEIAHWQDFIEIKNSHLTHLHQMPQLKHPNLAIKNMDSPAPERLTLPQGPNLASFQSQDENEMQASALVRAFEEKYVDSETKEPYSPCQLWTKLARKEAGHKESTGTYHSWLVAYYAVHGVKKDENPQDIKLKMSKLRKVG
jgi:hypothetical protein